MSRIACAWRSVKGTSGAGLARRGLALADDRDDLVEVVDRDLQSFQDVGALFGLPRLYWVRRTTSGGSRRRPEQILEGTPAAAVDDALKITPNVDWSFVNL
jgi:hypothetical protein